MKRLIALIVLAVLVGALVPAAVIAGVEPSPFRPPGTAKELWTAPGQIPGFEPEPQLPSWTPKSQLQEGGFDPQPEPPGRARDAWLPPGQLEGFEPQHDPPSWTPRVQASVIPS